MEKVCSVCKSSSVLITGSDEVLDHNNPETYQHCSGSGQLASLVEEDNTVVEKGEESTIRDYGFPARHGFDR